LNFPCWPSHKISLSLSLTEADAAAKEEELATAIMTKKKAPFRLLCDEPINEEQQDNSVVALHPQKMDELGFYRGDTILLKGKKRRDTVCVVMHDDTCPIGSIRINRVVRKNLRIRLGDIVSVHSVDCQYGERIQILPFEDTIQGLEGDLFTTFLKPYFAEAYRPVRVGDTFIVRAAMHAVESRS
jgi:transitional endoplasmic reticulum ATPase